ncbi:hypothetical protein ACFY8C_31025 [Streptomyces flavochromogenes]|uniref:Alpha/beta hydrolase n=1 Tax=Streptomyces flavochromogenes TaxID=68199 RepID=A0ABW6XYX6_9ACTN|nr:hypothetical protein [Streptomyces flavochromogenes]
MRKLILIHGRSQQMKDAEKLKQEWVDALHAGLRTADIDLEIPDEQIRFPYYGQTLFELAEDSTVKATEVIVKGSPSSAELDFIGAAVKDVAAGAGISEDDIVAAAEDPTQIRKDIQNWPWVLAALSAIDRVPGLSAVSIALATRDVYRYVRNPGIQTVIEDGVREAFTAGEESVVVAHSLGSVVAYNMMKREGKRRQWTVPALVTVGSPLGVNAICRLLNPIGRPDCLGDWYNAYDKHDVVALHPLDGTYFPVTPGIENYDRVKNPTSNKHGISGYLGDPVVAVRIRDALLDGSHR